MTEDIDNQLIEYFKNSKRESFIGLQNFQGIREYTKIPLAPITLLYGQNSAGKSSIHDAVQFIHDFLADGDNSNKTAEYLDRWANHNRISRPLTKGYLGNPDDVVVGMSSTMDDANYWSWESACNKNRDFDRDGLAWRFFNIGSETIIPFQVFFYFSNNAGQDNWHIRKYCLYLGDDICVDIVFNENCDSSYNEYSSCAINFNKEHLVYSLMDVFFEGGVEKVITPPLAERSDYANWFNSSERDCDEELRWVNPINWFSFTSEIWTQVPNEVLELRTFLSVLLLSPTQVLSDRNDYASIPPLRPIPTKHEAVFSNPSVNYTMDLGCWSYLAGKVCEKLIKERFPIDTDEVNVTLLDELFRRPDLDELNRILIHPLFLNTEYEVTGECKFLVSIDLLTIGLKSNQEMRNLLNGIDTQIHLKLRHKSNGALSEIEDVGVGISQIIPVLVAIMNKRRPRVFIQQPELHLHPKLQAQLGDVFIKCTNDLIEMDRLPRFVIESHSEHFLLRLLRRIRETNRSDIKNKLFGLYPENVSVLYVDKLEDGTTKILPLRISPEGEFIDRWPNGFFTERDGELFDE